MLEAPGISLADEWAGTLQPMSLKTWALLGAALVATRLLSAASSRRVTTTGAVELVPGQRYRMTYATTGVLTEAMARALVAGVTVDDLVVASGAPGYTLLSFTVVAPEQYVRATIGVPLSPSEAPDLTLARVVSLG